MTDIDKHTTSQVQIQTHDLGKSKQTRYTPPKLVKLVSPAGIEGKDSIIPTETGSLGAGS